MPRYRIRNLRTLPFTARSPHAGTYLLHEVQTMTASAAQETGLEEARLEVEVFQASTESGSHAKSVWHKTFTADHSKLFHRLSFGDFPLYRTVTYGCCGAENYFHYYNAATGALLGAGTSDLIPVSLTDAKGETVQRYIIVRAANAELKKAHDPREAILVTLASTEGAIATTRLLAPPVPENSEAALIEALEGKKILRLTPKHDRAAIVLKSAAGESIRIPFGPQGFLHEKAKLPEGWSLKNATID